MNAKNISRYTYRDTAFLGWRLALMRKGEQYTQYFSDRQFGGSRASFRAAITRRNDILRALSAPGATPAAVFDAYRAIQSSSSPLNKAPGKAAPSVISAPS